MPTSYIFDKSSELFDDLVGGIFGKKYSKVTDLNKESKKFSLELYGVFSSNISPTIMASVQRMLAAKYTATANIVLTNLILKVIEDQALGKTKESVADAVHRSMANSQEDGNSIIQSVADRANFSESIAFNEKTLASTARVITEAKGNTKIGSQGDPVVVGSEYTQSHTYEIPSRAEDGRIRQLHSKDKHGNMYTQDAMETRTFYVNFNTKVSAVPIEAGNLIETVGTTKDRSILFNYIKMRAGVSSFLKDFVVNLKEIEKEVSRNVSDSLEDRMLAAMMRKGGFLVPEMFSKNIESRHYIMCLEKSDVDALRANYGFDLRKPNALRTLFERYSILSLVIVDTIAKTMMIHDSDKPLNGVLVSFEKNLSNDEAVSMFAKLVRS